MPYVGVLYQRAFLNATVSANANIPPQYNIAFFQVFLNLVQSGRVYLLVWAVFIFLIEMSNRSS